MEGEQRSAAAAPLCMAPPAPPLLRVPHEDEDGNWARCRRGPGWFPGQGVGRAGPLLFPPSVSFAWGTDHRKQQIVCCRLKMRLTLGADGKQTLPRHLTKLPSPCPQLPIMFQTHKHAEPTEVLGSLSGFFFIRTVWSSQA